MRTIIMLAVGAMALVAVGAQADCPPDPEYSGAFTNCPGSYANPCVVYNRLDGLGRGFTEAHLSNGAIFDATIVVDLVDCHGDPMVGLPAEDMWLETTEGGLVFPAGGTIADGATNANGSAYWREPMSAGGCSLGEGTIVRALGWAIGAPLNVAHVSADMNGDLVLNLADVQRFAAAYMDVYDGCADLDYNGNMNLSDLNLLARAYGMIP